MKRYRFDESKVRGFVDEAAIRHRILLTAILMGVLLLSSTFVAASTPDANAIATDRIKDLTTVLHVVDAETHMDQLEKIGGNFKRSYYFKRAKVAYKFPNKSRMETKVGFIGGVLIFNGDTKFYQVALQKGTSSVAGHPGQKQSLLQLGIFAKDYLITDYKPIFLKQAGNLLVFKLEQRNTDNKSHEIVWVNPKTAIIERRQTFNGDNVLQQESRYKNPVQIRPGIWVPTRLEVYNQFGKLGGVQVYEQTRVNLGLSDDMFKTS